MFRRRKRTQKDFSDELESHLALEADRLREEGMSETDAATAARRNLGNITKTEERFYESHRWLWLDYLWQDLRYGLRTLRRSPGLTAVAVLSLALGIGANTAIFSLMNAVMLRELPVQKPSQLVLFGTGEARGDDNGFATTKCYSYPFFRDMRQKNQVFSDISAVLSIEFKKMHGTVGDSAALEPMSVQLVTGTYFSMLGVQPILGQSFTEAVDEPAGGHPVAIVSYSWWKRRFARDPAIVGKTVTLESRIYTIVGVMPPRFFGTEVGQSPDLWIPLSMEEQVSPGWNGLENPIFQSLYVLGRLKPGVSVRQAEANVNVLARQIWHEEAGPVLTREQQTRLEHAYIKLTPAARGMPHIRYEASTPLLILMAIVGLVLLIACANIANLLLARATTRQREIAVRMAIGARRARLIRQMLTESLLMAFLGGTMGILLAWWGSEALVGMISSGRERLPLSVTPDGTILLFTLAVSIITALLFGIVPALRATRINLTPALKEGRGMAVASSRGRLGNALIVSQVAISLVLLVGAGLFLHSLLNLAHVDTGFDRHNVLLFSIDPADVGYKENARLASLYQQIEQRVGALPGVHSASISFFTFNQGEWGDDAVVEGRGPAPEYNHNVLYNVIGTEYFKTMGIPLLTGRVFNAHDTANSSKVAIINQTMAQEFFPGGSPIGRRFGIGDDPKHSADIEVVGVVKNAKYLGLEERAYPAAYFPYTQNTQYYGDLEVRYSGDPGAIISEVRRAVGEVNRSLPLSYQETLAQQVEQSISGQTLVARLSAFFGLLAVFLACIGIYGLMSYAVTRRTNEIGIRMALGAERWTVVWMVMRESLALVGVGLAIGLPVALAADRLVAGMLFGLKPADPISIAGAALALLAFAALAGYLPARRAAKIEPTVALRYE